MKTLSDVYHEERRSLIAEILRSNSKILHACHEPKSLKLVEFPNEFRKGRKRDNWWICGLEEYWEHLTFIKFKHLNGTQLGLDNPQHQAILELAAECHIGLKTEKKHLNVLSGQTQKDLGFVLYANKKEERRDAKKKKEEARKKRLGRDSPLHQTPRNEGKNVHKEMRTPC